MENGKYRFCIDFSWKYPEKRKKNEIFCQLIEWSFFCRPVETQNIADLTKANNEVKDHRPKRICLVGSLAEDENLVEAAESLKVPVVVSQNGLELLDEKDICTYFVLEEFEGQIFETVSKRSKHK